MLIWLQISIMQFQYTFGSYLALSTASKILLRQAVWPMHEEIKIKLPNKLNDMYPDGGLQAHTQDEDSMLVFWCCTRAAPEIQPVITNKSDMVHRAT